MDSRSASPRIFLTDPPDQLPQPAINPRLPRPLPRLPAPDHAAFSSVPAQDRLRLHDPNNAKQARTQPGEQHQKKPVDVPELEPRLCPSQGHIELMPKNQILGFEPVARLEQVAKEQSERMGASACGDGARACRRHPQSNLIPASRITLVHMSCSFWMNGPVCASLISMMVPPIFS